MVDLPDDAQRGRQIVRPYKHDIHTFNAEDVIQIVNGLLALCLKDHHGVLCLGKVIRTGDRTIGGGTDEAARASAAAGGELCRGDGDPRLLCGVDLGDHHRAGTHVQSLVDPDVRSPGNAHHRANARHVGSADQVLQVLKGAGTVLHVQQHEIVTGVARRLHEGGVGGDHKGSESTLLGV